MKIYKDIPYVKGGGEEHWLDLYLPEGKKDFPTFIFFHGGGFVNGSKSGKIYDVLSSYFTERGIALASANYRMYPTATYPDFIRDGAAAVAWIKNNIAEYGGGNEIYVGGSSAGGYLSMMLCYDAKYLGLHGIKPTDITAYIHDAGQPTTHFNVMVERGYDRYRCMIDDAAPLYHVGNAKEYSPQLIFVADNDIKCRYEQTKLLVATLESLGYDMSRVRLMEMKGYNHTGYTGALDEDGVSIFGKAVSDFLDTVCH